jgi:hypothetical protein
VLATSAFFRTLSTHFGTPSNRTSEIYWPGKAGGGGDALSLAAFIASERTDHRVPHAVSCRALDVSESWFYKWRKRAPTPAQQRHAELDAKVVEIFEDSGGEPRTGDSSRLHAELRDLGCRVTEKTVAASMARQGSSPDRRSAAGA